MVIRIPNTDAVNCPGAVAGADGRIPQCLDVTIDIDGVDNNGNVCSGGDGIDCHTFTLGSDGVVTPVFTDDSNSEDWIRFKVYHIDDNGDKIVDATNIKYECAVRYICCKNDISRRECTYKDDSGNDIRLTQGDCTVDFNDGCNQPGMNDGTMRFMEVIPPIK